MERLRISKRPAAQKKAVLSNASGRKIPTRRPEEDVLPATSHAGHSEYIE